MSESTFIGAKVITGRYSRGKIELTRKVKLAEGTLVKVAIPQNGKIAKQQKKENALMRQFRSVLNNLCP